MSEDDDWFERALQEDEGDSDGEDDETADSRFADAEQEGFGDASDLDAGDDAGFGSVDDADRDDVADFGDADSDGANDFGDADRDDVADFGDADSDGANDFGDATDDSSGDGFAEAAPYDESEDEELFEDDFATAFQNAPGGGFGAGAGETDAGGGFGMDADEGFGDSGDPFESEAFDDEEFESDIPRIDLGIDGLDSMIQGGVPERSLITTIGSAGTGKTTFGLQFLHEALAQGENAVFITLEESHDRIVNTATEKGWDFEEYENEGSLAVIDLDPIEMANSLTSIRNDLPRLVEEFGATRLVLDSVSLLEMMYDDQATRRNEVYDFTKSLKEAGVTTMLTSEASEDSAYASRHGIIEYLVDAVFVLRYIRSSDDFRETRLAVEIQKIRDANHSREIKPYSITNDGISVYRQANIF